MKEVKKVEKVYVRGQVFSCFRLYFVAVELYVWWSNDLLIEIVIDIAVWHYYLNISSHNIDW